MAYRSTVGLGPPAVEVRVGHDVPDEVRAETNARFDQVLRAAGQPIRGCRVRLDRLGDPALDRPVVAQANVVALGYRMRVQVTAHTAHEAVELLAARLRRRLARVASMADQDGFPTATSLYTASRGRWRCLGEPTFPPCSQAGVAGQRRLVRRKTIGPAVMTPDDAAFEMDLRDYQMYLFTDAKTGQDSVVYRAGATGYRLAQVRPCVPRARSTVVPLTVSRHPALMIDLEGARSLLDTTGHPFMFFIEPESGRAWILYRRYDGHFGLLVPASPE